jgi:antitoxin component of MazEF toxin-antitoxin module
MLICPEKPLVPGDILQAKGKVAKKFALYPPKQIVKQLGLREGQTVAYEVEGHQLVVKPIEDPLELALKSQKWAKTTITEFEAESQREQNEFSQ